MSTADPSPTLRALPVTESGRHPDWWTRLCERLVRETLGKMPAGHLRLNRTDGSTIQFGGRAPGPSAELTILSPAFYRRCVLHGDIGFGESFVAGEWTSPDVTAVIAWFCANVEAVPGMSGSRQGNGRFNLLSWLNRLGHLRRANTPRNSRRNIREHYDLGNAFYRLWLDPTMSYSSAIFEAPDQPLEAAQSAKYERLCRQLRVRPGEHVLEIGCGWGGFARHAVKHHGCRVTGITISGEQLAYARDLAQREGWADRAEFQLCDYRKLAGRFDHIVSIEMLEAVGDEYLETFFTRVHSLLKPGGVFAAQFITCPDSRHDRLRGSVDWIQKHIFPGSLLLSLARVNEAARRTGSLWMHDLKDLGPHYALTLRHWRDTFNREVGRVRELGFDEAFVRKWNYYLSYCEAAFATRNISVVQATWAHPNCHRLAGLNPR